MTSPQKRTVITTITWSAPATVLLINVFLTPNTNPQLSRWILSAIWSVGAIWLLKTSLNKLGTIILWTCAWATILSIPVATELIVNGLGLNQNIQKLLAIALAAILLMIIYAYSRIINEQTT